MEQTFSEVYSRILTDILNKYWAYSDEVIDVMLEINGYEIKQNVANINELEVVIYTNDHNPPHFHVISKDKSINAKFTIENCEQISGELSSRQLKKIKAFYHSPKGKMVMQKIWDKRNY